MLFSGCFDFQEFRAQIAQISERVDLEMFTGSREREEYRGGFCSLFAGGDEWLTSASVLMSRCASAKRHGLNPWAYLTDVLTHSAAKPADVTRLLRDSGPNSTSPPATEFLIRHALTQRSSTPIQWPLTLRTSFSKALIATRKSSSPSTIGLRKTPRPGKTVPGAPDSRRGYVYMSMSPRHESRTVW